MKKLVLLFAVIVSLSLAVVAQEMKRDQMEHPVQKAATVKGWISDSECAAHGVKNCPTAALGNNFMSVYLLACYLADFVLSQPTVVMASVP